MRCYGWSREASIIISSERTYYYLVQVLLSNSPRVNAILTERASQRAITSKSDQEKASSIERENAILAAGELEQFRNLIARALSTLYCIVYCKNYRKFIFVYSPLHRSTYRALREYRN